MNTLIQHREERETFKDKNGMSIYKSSEIEGEKMFKEHNLNAEHISSL